MYPDFSCIAFNRLGLELKAFNDGAVIGIPLPFTQVIPSFFAADSRFGRFSRSSFLPIISKATACVPSKNTTSCSMVFRALRSHNSCHNHGHSLIGKMETVRTLPIGGLVNQKLGFPPIQLV